MRRAKASTGLITYEDSLTMPENQFEEIVDGESHIMPMPTLAHGFLLRKFSSMLDAQVDSRVYIIFGPDTGLGIRRRPVFTYRVPDRAVFRLHTLQDDGLYIWSAPEWIFECLSPSNRKGPVGKLLEDYASIRVPEVWLADPATRTVSIWACGEGEPRHERDVTSGSAVSHLGIEIDIDALWRAFHERKL